MMNDQNTAVLEVSVEGGSMPQPLRNDATTVKVIFKIIV